MKITWDSDYKIWLVCAKDDPRPVLRSIYLDPAGFLVATDTLALAIIPCLLEGAPEGFDGLLLPPDHLKDTARHTTHSGQMVWAEIDQDQGTVTGWGKKGTTIRTLLPDQDQQFPLWRNLIEQSLNSNYQEGVYGDRWLMDNPWTMTRLAEALGLPKDKPVVYFSPVKERGKTSPPNRMMLGKDVDPQQEDVMPAFGIFSPGNPAAYHRWERRFNQVIRIQKKLLRNPQEAVGKAQVAELLARFGTPAEPKPAPEPVPTPAFDAYWKGSIGASVEQSRVEG